MSDRTYYDWSKLDQHQKDIQYIKLAYHVGAKSPDHRKKVGCVIASPSGYSIFSFNSPPKDDPRYSNPVENGKSIPTLIHAEEKAVMGFLEYFNYEEHNDIRYTLYCTSCPCLRCASKIVYTNEVLCGKYINRVVFVEDHDNNESIEYLEKCGIKVERLDYENNQTT